MNRFSKTTRGLVLDPDGRYVEYDDAKSAIHSAVEAERDRIRMAIKSLAERKNAERIFYEQLGDAGLADFFGSSWACLQDLQRSLFEGSDPIPPPPPVPQEPREVSESKPPAPRGA